MSAKLPKQGPDVMPDAVYFDANALFGISHGATDPAYGSLRAAAERVGARLFAPEVAVQEWTRRMQVDSRSEMDRLRQSAARLGRNLGRTPLSYEEPGGLDQSISGVMAARLADAGVTSVPTPAGISIGTVVNMAVERVPPFEEKGEKGFRDTVILLTIIDHMVGATFANGILVSADRIFTDEAIKSRAGGVGLNLLVAADYQETTKLLESQKAFAEKTRLDRWIGRIRSFLDGRFGEISDYIRDNRQRIPENYLMYDEGHRAAFIKELLSVTPRHIARVTPGLWLSKKSLDEDIGYVTAYVTTDFDVVAVPYVRGGPAHAGRVTVAHRVIVEIHIDVKDDAPVGLTLLRLH